MALAFDTDLLDAHDHMDAVAAAFESASAPAYVSRTDTDVDLRVRMDVRPVGTAYLFRGEMGGIALRRTGKQVVRAPSSTLAVAVHEAGAAQHEQHGRQREIRAGDLLIADLNSPYEFVFAGNGASQALHVPLDRIDLAHELLSHAGTTIQANPLRHIVIQHIRGLAAAPHGVDPAAEDVLGNATIELIRALLLACTVDSRRSEALAVTLDYRIQAYVRRHLRDPALTPESIARAHSISVRQLYKVIAPLHPAGPAHWISKQRLAAAHRELSDPSCRFRSIAMIARSWGFVSAPHFSRRFRQEYGMSPREWRELSAATEHRGGAE